MTQGFKKMLIAVAAVYLTFAAVRILEESRAGAAPITLPGQQCGVMQLAAATATVIPTPGTPLDNRSSVSVQNLDTQPIWCRYDNTATNLNSMQVEGAPALGRAGGLFIGTVGWDGVQARPWCYSVAGTGPTGIRWCETR